MRGKKTKRLSLVLFIALAGIFSFGVPTFALTNPTSISINSAAVFQGIFESGDFTFMVNYNVAYASPPSETPQSAYYLAMYDSTGTQLLGLIPIQHYGNYPLAIYFSAAAATTAGITNNYPYQLKLTMNPNMASLNGLSLAGTVNYTVLTLGLNNWMIGNQAAQKTAMKNYMVNMALNISPTWVTPAVSSNVITSIGQIYFEDALPGVSAAVPDAFAISSSSINPGSVTSSGALSTLLTPENQSGQKIADSFAGIAAYLGMQTSGRVLLGAFCFFIYLITASIIFVNSGNSIGGMVLASPILIMGSLLGWLPIVVLFIGVMLIVTYALYYIFV